MWVVGRKISGDVRYGCDPLWGPTPRARRALFRVPTCLVPVGQRSPYRSCALSPCFPSLVPYHLTAAKENAMAIARYLRVFALAPLACLITTALAQGERPWVDPPPPAPASPPSSQPAPAAPTFEDAPSSRGKPLAPPRNQETRNPRGIQFGSRSPSPLQHSDARLPTGSPSVERNPTTDVGEGRLAAKVAPRPSFNCRSARSSVERAICADPVLAAKDLRMATLYEQAGGSRRGPVDATQWRWLAARNACARAQSSALNACIDHIYNARIAELSRASQ
jgi:hypothetical protein